MYFNDIGDIFVVTVVCDIMFFLCVIGVVAIVSSADVTVLRHVNGSVCICSLQLISWSVVRPTWDEQQPLHPHHSAYTL